MELKNKFFEKNLDWLESVMNWLADLKRKQNIFIMLREDPTDHNINQIKSIVKSFEEDLYIIENLRVDIKTLNDMINNLKTCERNMKSNLDWYKKNWAVEDAKKD